MYYPDLSTFEYNSAYTGLNVGWLDADHEFPTGECLPDFLEALHWVIAGGRFTKCAAAGLHFCELCDQRTNVAELNGEEVLMGNTEIEIPYRRKIYIAPSLVYHYVEAHQYLPPDPFIKGVLKLWSE